MDQEAKLQVFQSQTTNVRALRSSMRQVCRSINAGLRMNDEPTTTAFTKTYALMFCAWAEANFSKVLHTPYGLDLDEIEQVKIEKDKNGIQRAWKKCVTLGLRHLDARRGSFRPNAQQKLYRLIDSHVFDPAQLRNKLAHGQWVIALNRDNTAVNQDLTRGHIESKHCPGRRMDEHSRASREYSRNPVKVLKTDIYARLACLRR